MTLRAFLVALLAALPAFAGEALSPENFERLAEGHTLRFTHLGEAFGAEQYFAGRRSLWRFADGTCTAGRWWPEGDHICFRYEGNPEDQCWRFLNRPGGLAAELVEEGSSTGFVLEMNAKDGKPLACPAPDVGT